MAEGGVVGAEVRVGIMVVGEEGVGGEEE